MTYATVSLRHVADIRISNVDKHIRPDEQRVFLCNYVDVYYNDRLSSKVNFSRGSVTPHELRRFALQRGDVVITKDSELRDDIAIPAIVDENGLGLVCGYHLAILRPKQDDIYPPYLFWSLNSKPVREHFSNHAKGVTRFGLTIQGIGSAPIFLPDFEAQRRIADCLDRQTARIDSLMRQKNHLIGLLGEKVRASLVERIRHLRAPSRRLRLLGSLKNGVGFPVAEQGNPHGEIPFFKVKHLTEAAFPSRLTKAEDYVSREVAGRLGATIFPAGTIVFAKIGAALLLSRFTVLGSRSCIDNNMSAFVPNAGVLDPEYARLAFSTIPMARYANPGAVPSLNTTAFLEHAIKVPSITEQKSFVAETIATVERLRRVTSTVESSLSVLDELRLAIISGAVAGNIDV